MRRYIVDGVVPPSSPAISDREVHAARLGQCHLLGHEPGRNVKQKIMTSVEDLDPHGSALVWLSWIQIRIGNAALDPGAGKLTRINKVTWICSLSIKFLYLHRYVYDLIATQYIFYFKTSVLVTAKSDKVPDPDPCCFGSLDPDPKPHWGKK